MTDYFVGPGGLDANSGLTWALRKLTLNGAEDVPVVAGDNVYVGPGVYRETLTLDVSGAAGNIITYIGDVTGQNTDSVGGIVRLAGTDNDQTFARDHGIVGNDRDFRTFRGIALDTFDRDAIDAENCDNWIIEDCTFQGSEVHNIDQRDGNDWTIRRCVFMIGRFQHLSFVSGATVDDSGHLFENCLFSTNTGQTVLISRYGDVIIRNCIIAGSTNSGVWVNISPNAGHPCVVNNCILFSTESAALRGAALGDLVENFNTFFLNVADRQNVAVGANSVTFPPILAMPLLYAGTTQLSGFEFPWWFSELSEWSEVRAITGANEPAVDLRGVGRPVTAAKNSWGPAQFIDMERETGTVRTGLVSLVLHDAGRHQIFVPVDDTETTIEIFVQREAAYAGGNPQMIIKQPGQADRTTTDAGAAGAFNQLTDTFTPAALPPYVVVELVSQNTAVAGAFEVFWDDLDVT